MVHSPSDSSSSSAPLLAHSVHSPHSGGDDSLELKGVYDANDDETVDDLDLEASLLSPTSEPRTPLPPYSEKSPRRARARRIPSFLAKPRMLAIAVILLSLVAFGMFSILYVSNGNETQAGLVAEDSVLSPTPSVEPDFDPEENFNEVEYPESVLGAPTESFKDNLRNDTQYITSWISAGWTNDFMTYVNLLNLALFSGRTAIIPPFAPSHVGSAAGFVPFGDVFDVPRLSLLLEHPVIEWRDLKREDSEHTDEVGCWSIWSTVQPVNSDHAPRGNSIEQKLVLDVSYTPVPTYTIMFPEFDNDPHARFDSIAALTFPDGRTAAHLPAHAPFPGKGSGHTALPDEHMACFDFPYYLASVNNFEFQYDYSPAWRFVGTHAHWNPRIETIARDLVRQTFGVASDAPMPPFISIHVRHGDFGVYCQGAENADACFAPLSAFAARVDEVKAELREKKGIEVEHVLVTSDERDVEWWNAVRELGWEWVDHAELKTVETYGLWYPVLLDAVVQSLGAGFVGTDRSTMSLIAQRRVEDWNGGATREVRWGSPGADDHKRSLPLGKRGFGGNDMYEFVI
ncbi:hypothetical protein M0805_004118 [Coniferiporia weirii]|nr:hypothetical protein M0805_004118 [Coniferiporia weirii]